MRRRAANLKTIDRNHLRCEGCHTDLPLYLPVPGETGSSWCCVNCDARYFGVFDTDAEPELLVLVRPADDPNPRVMVGREVVGQLFRRRDRGSRVLDARKNSRSECVEELTLILPDRRVSATSVDASVGGLACLASDPVTPGQSLMVRFESVANSPICTGEVSSCTPDGDRFRIGIAFTR